MLQSVDVCDVVEEGKLEPDWNRWTCNTLTVKSCEGFGWLNNGFVSNMHDDVHQERERWGGAGKHDERVIQIPEFQDVMLCCQVLAHAETFIMRKRKWESFWTVGNANNRFKSVASVFNQRLSFHSLFIVRDEREHALLDCIERQGQPYGAHLPRVPRHHLRQRAHLCPRRSQDPSLLPREMLFRWCRSKNARLQFLLR